MDGRQLIPLLLMICFSVCHCNIPIERISANGTNETNGEKGIWDWITGGGDKKSICDERCGLPYISKDDDDDDRVVGGVETKPNQYPWMAFLQIKKSDFFKESKSYCGATLIKKQFLLTAAHCVYSSGLKSIDAHLGFHYLKTSRYQPTGYEKIISVTKVYIHEDFDPEIMENDLAILELAKPINLTDQIHTLCLADEKMKKLVEGTELTLAGWGGTTAFGTTFYPKMLLSTTMKVVDKKKCREAFGRDSAKYIVKSSICAGGSTSNSCNGDSGGPLMLAKEQGKLGKRYIQVGVVSFGDEECDTSLPGVYSRVSKQLSWIQKVTERKDSCKPLTFN